MSDPAIAFFGEAERGEFCTAYYCETLPRLVEYFGHPPLGSFGIHFAIQALLYHYHIVFLRVNNEGFSYQDYMDGLRLLEHQHVIKNIIALGLPGVGDSAILEAMSLYCISHHSVMLLREPDLYDYLTSSYSRSC